MVDRDILDNNGKYDLDPIKLVINVRDLGFSGYEVERILRSKYKIQVELSDLYNIITMITIGDNEETLNTLIKALKKLRKVEIYKNSKSFNSHISFTRATGIA